MQKLGSNACDVRGSFGLILREIFHLKLRASARRTSWRCKLLKRAHVRNMTRRDTFLGCPQRKEAFVAMDNRNQNEKQNQNAKSNNNNQQKNAGNFAQDRERAPEAGKKSGEHSHDDRQGK
jgi:uncharacterized protein